MFVRGMDSDNYDGNVPLSHFEKLRREADIRFNIIGLEAQMPYANQQREACKAAGMVVPFAYKFLYWASNDLERMKQAAGFGELVAIDCEYEVPLGWGVSRVIDRIYEARELLVREGRYWGIYTGEWWWKSQTENTFEFADDQLWHAAYPLNRPALPPVLPPLDYLPPEPCVVNYGGWTVANVHQYANTCYGDELGPWAFDMNAADEAILGPPPAPPAPQRVIVGINQEFHDGDKVRLTINYSDGISQVVDE